MKRLFILLIVLLGLFNREVEALDLPNDTLYFYHESNSDHVPDFCDNVLTIIRNGNEISCYFRGTSDEFDEAREGYFPGFIVLKAKEFVMNDGIISFVLDSNNKYFLNRPIVSEEIIDCSVIPSGYEKWLQMQKYYWKQVAFTGTYDDNSIVLVNKTIYPDLKCEFIKCDLKTVKEKYNTDLFSDDLAKQNAAKR